MPQIPDRLFIRLPFLILSIILTFAFSVEAQSTAEKWSPLGPDEVHVNCITVDPVDHNTVYAGTRTAVFKSTDGGQTWVDTQQRAFRISISIQ